MARTRTIEQDHGTYAGLVTHQHNGYYAGDFSARGAVRASADTALRDGFGWQPRSSDRTWNPVVGERDFAGADRVGLVAFP